MCVLKLVQNLQVDFFSVSKSSEDYFHLDSQTSIVDSRAKQSEIC